MRIRILCTILLVVIGLSNCRPSVELDQSEALPAFSVAGSDSPIPLMQYLLDTFAEQRGAVLYQSTIVDSQQLLSLLAADQIDAGLTLRPLDLPPGWQQHPFARDGLAIIVHPDNPVENLTLRDLAHLYAGYIFNWRDVQGSPSLDQVVQVVTQAPEADITTIFQALVLGEQRMTPNARVFPNSQALVNFVSDTPQAIGYVGQAHLSQKVKAVSVEEVLAVPQTIANSAYPLTYRFYLIAKLDTSPFVQEFVDFVIQRNGQSLVEAQGYGRGQ